MSKMNRKTYVATLCGLLLFFAGCGQKKEQATTEFTDQQADSMLVTEVAKLRQRIVLPAEVAPNVVLDSLRSEPGRNIHYFYTTAVATVSRENLESFKPLMITALKSDPNNNQFMKAKVVYHYHYYDSTGLLLGKIVITPHDYK